MSVLLAEHIVNIEFADLARRRPIVRPDRPPSRAPGVHQSDILYHVAVEVGWLNRQEVLDEVMPWRMARGIMFEEFAFSSILSDSEWQPGEKTKDRISVNCDGLALDDTYGPLVDETKDTEKKLPVNGAEFLADKKFKMWQHQGRGYGYVYGPEVVRWTIMFSRGDYAGSGPVCAQYIVRFSKSELKQTWEMEQRYYDEVARQLGVVEGTGEVTDGSGVRW